MIVIACLDYFCPSQVAGLVSKLQNFCRPFFFDLSAVVIQNSTTMHLTVPHYCFFFFFFFYCRFKIKYSDNKYQMTYAIVKARKTSSKSSSFQLCSQMTTKVQLLVSFAHTRRWSHNSKI